MKKKVARSPANRITCTCGTCRTCRRRPTYKKYDSSEERRAAGTRRKRERYQSDPIYREKMKASARAWTAAHPHYDKTFQLLHRYRLTASEYDALLEKQNYVCAICKKPETSKHSKTGRALLLSVDHDHTTGAVRGLLCMKCNRGLGCFKDDPDLLRTAAGYVYLAKQGTSES